MWTTWLWNLFSLIKGKQREKNQWHTHIKLRLIWRHNNIFSYFKRQIKYSKFIFTTEKNSRLDNKKASPSTEIKNHTRSSLREERTQNRVKLKKRITSHDVKATGCTPSNHGSLYKACLVINTLQQRLFHKDNKRGGQQSLEQRRRPKQLYHRLLFMRGRPEVTINEKILFRLSFHLHFTVRARPKSESLTTFLTQRI